MSSSGVGGPVGSQPSMSSDEGHQAYVHKILTNRRSRMSTIRQTGGLSGEEAVNMPHQLHL